MLLSLVPSFPIIYAENSTALNIIININKLLKRSQHSLCSNYIVRLWSKIYYCSVIKSSPTLCDPMDCSPPGSFAMGLGKNIGVGYHFLLQGIFLTQVLNLRLLHWQAGSLSVSKPPGKPRKTYCVQHL